MQFWSKEVVTFDERSKCDRQGFHVLYLFSENILKGAGGQPSELPGPGKRSCSLDPLLHC